MFEFTDSSNTNADPVTGKGEETRVAKGPAGSHAISGSWRASKMDAVSDNGLLFTYKVSGDSLTMTSPTGQSYTAKLDGTEAPFKGDPGTTSVSVKKMGMNTMEETDKRDGKVISVARMTLSADGSLPEIRLVGHVASQRGVVAEDGVFGDLLMVSHALEKSPEVRFFFVPGSAAIVEAFRDGFFAGFGVVFLVPLL